MFPYWQVTFRTLKTDQQQQLIIKLDGICLSIALGIPKTEISLKIMHAWGLIFHESHSYLVILGHSGHTKVRIHKVCNPRTRESYASIVFTIESASCKCNSICHFHIFSLDIGLGSCLKRKPPYSDGKDHGFLEMFPTQFLSFDEGRVPPWCSRSSKIRS